MTVYVIRRLGSRDLGAFASATEATLFAFRLGWPVAVWTIEPVER